MPTKKTATTSRKPKSATAKTSTRSSRGKNLVEEVKTIMEEPVMENKRVGVKLRKSHITIFSVVLVLLIIIGLLYFFRGLFVAATVNGEPISRLSVIQELEKQGGKQALSSLVTKTLILQEAHKKNITVSQKEIDDELKRIQSEFSAQGQNLDQMLAAQGMTRNKLVEQIEIQKMIEKLLGKGIQVTDKEVDSYLEKNKNSLPANTKPEDLKSQVREQLKQQKLSEKFQTWIADLQRTAKINYIIKY